MNVVWVENVFLGSPIIERDYDDHTRDALTFAKARYTKGRNAPHMERRLATSENKLRLGVKCTNNWLKASKVHFMWGYFWLAQKQALTKLAQT